MRAKYLTWIFNLILPVAALSLTFALVLSGCGGSGSSGSGTGDLSMGITDSAHDDLTEVNLRVIGVELRRQGGNGNGERIVEIDLRDANGDAMEFNLLDYQHGAAFPLFANVQVPAGDYVQARLILEAPAQTANECALQDPLAGSHVVMASGGPVAIYVPSGNNNGVRLVRPFTVPEDGEAHIVLDLDLRKALHRPTGQTCYFLRPTFRIEKMQDTGHIAGTVAMSLLDGSNGLCSDNDLATGNVVYVYSGTNQTPDDIDAANDGDADPIATSQVSLDSTDGEYRYVVAYLPPASYTVAFTCEADQDRLPVPNGATQDERAANDNLEFQLPQNATVTINSTTTVNFTP